MFVSFSAFSFVFLIVVLTITFLPSVIFMLLLYWYQIARLVEYLIIVFQKLVLGNPFLFQLVSKYGRCSPLFDPITSITSHLQVFHIIKLTCSLICWLNWLKSALKFLRKSWKCDKIMGSEKLTWTFGSGELKTLAYIT